VGDSWAHSRLFVVGSSFAVRG